jgi:hypothetical protein
MRKETAKFLSDPLEALETSVNTGLCIDDVGTSPLKPSSFAEGLPGVESSALPSSKITRTEILNHASKNTLDTPTLCAGILAWGGMHRNNRDSLFKRSPKDWLKICDDIREGQLDHIVAYEAFRELRKANKLKGMGAAFFTKLIYALSPRDGDHMGLGYIMDQWAGCSINVLTGTNVVLMNSTATWKNGTTGLSKTYEFTVSDLNTGSDYGAFCVYMDNLSAHFDVSPHQIDRAIMSDGGRNPLPWRKFVIDHRNP